MINACLSGGKFGICPLLGPQQHLVTETSFWSQGGVFESDEFFWIILLWVVVGDVLFGKKIKISVFEKFQDWDVVFFCWWCFEPQPLDFEGYCRWKKSCTTWDTYATVWTIRRVLSCQIEKTNCRSTTWVWRHRRPKRLAEYIFFAASPWLSKMIKLVALTYWYFWIVKEDSFMMTNVSTASSRSLFPFTKVCWNRLQSTLLMCFFSSNVMMITFTDQLLIFTSPSLQENW